MSERSDAYELDRKKYTVPLDKYRWIAEHLHGPQLIADAPCGTGAGSDYLHKQGHHGVGFDQKPVFRTEYDGGFILCDVTHQTFQGFDVVVCIGAIETFVDPLTWLKNLKCRELFVDICEGIESGSWAKWCKHTW